ncbi:MAG: RNA-binding cell elongation regulator Jag/EloR [Actinomycetota bacterium]
MEWVETTGRTIEEAKNIALDQLGVAEDDADFEVVEEPKPGLFGRTRGEARVRARVRPTSPRGKGGERRERNSRGRNNKGRSGESGNGRREGGRDGGRNENRSQKRERPAREPREDRPPREKVDVDPAAVADSAVNFLSGLVTAFGLKADVVVNREDTVLDVQVNGDELGLLVGPRGTTLLAIQDLTRVASQRRLGDQDTRLRVDVAGYRERRKEALGRFALKVAEEVKESGSARVLEPMASADRKIVHDALLDVEGIVTRSTGEEPRRRVVVDIASGD